MAKNQSNDSLPFNTQIDVKISRVDTPVPVIEGIHLHSIYNPTKEAEGFVQKYEAQLQTQNRVLVLGLGFGYHVWCLEALLGRMHDDWKIIIIEPDPRLRDEFNRLMPVELSARTRIVSCNNVSQYYDDMDLVHFMASKPLVMAHPATFNLRETFFKNFMSFQASNNIADVASKVSDVALRNHLLALGESTGDFDEELKRRLQGNKLSTQDFLLGAFAEMTAGVQA